MARFIFIVLFLNFFRFGNAKDLIDTTRIRLYFQSFYKVQIERKQINEDLCILDIGSSHSKFYSHKFSRYTFLKDSIKNVTKSRDILIQFITDKHRGGQGQTYILYKNFPRQGLLTYIDIIEGNFHFYYEEEIPKQEWTLEEGDTVIAGYACNKASCLFRGRKWTAWYATDLPYDNGPWKLGGLPGLILAAKESEGIFSFVCTGIEKKDGTEPIVIDLKQCEKTTPKKFQQLVQEYWKDQWNVGNRLRGWKQSKPPAAQRTFTACLMEYYE